MLSGVVTSVLKIAVDLEVPSQVMSGSAAAAVASALELAAVYL
jgi:hypothetical protein